MRSTSKNRSIRSSFFFTIFFALLLGLGCSVETQKARENFEGGFVSKELQKLANQELELRTVKSEILERTQSDLQKLTIPVAVIDNGVDLAHPDLTDRFIYDIANGEIIGSGLDVMGDDSFASSSLINPELFATTASELKNGLIVLGTRNPFEFLIDHNKRFTAHFLRAFKADPVLQNSLFATIDEESFNVMGLYKIALTAEKKEFFDSETYESKKTSGLLLNASFRASLKEKAELADEWGFAEIHYLVDRKVYNERGTGGLTIPFGNLARIEHGDRLYKLILDTTKSYPFYSELDAAVTRLADFRLARSQQITVDMVAEKSSAANFMSSALEYQLQGTNFIDPLIRLRHGMINVKVQELDLFREKTDYPEFIVEKNAAELAHVKTGEILSTYQKAMSQIQLTATERADKRTFDQRLGNVLKFNSYVLRERASDIQELTGPTFNSDFSSRYRKVYFRTNHPYLSALGEDESHGTHVSGIIAKQHPDIRIYPVRVTTRSALVTKSEYERLTKNFKAQFKVWLAEPIVVRAIYQRVPAMRFDFAAEPATKEERLAYAERASASMDEAIDIEFEGGSLNFLFFEELEKAIEAVALKKIKVANISLGAELSKEVPRLSEINPDQDMVQFFRYLQFEHVKYRLGQLLTTTAKNTLYVVAAGNSSAWVDGKTRSALPVDLGSHFLKKFEDGQEFIAPNNHVKNVLGVGSLNPDHDLSDFTNVLIGLNTPMIFTEGEDILSPIKSTDTSGVVSYIAKKVPDLIGPVAVSDTRVTDHLKTLPEFAELAKKEDFADRISRYWGAHFSVYGQLRSATLFHLAAKHSDHRGKMSGTSMATPAIVGILASQISEAAREHKLSTEQIYESEIFTPEKLIAKLNAIGTPVFPENSLFPFKKVDVRGKYDRGTEIQALDKEIAEILK